MAERGDDNMTTDTLLTSEIGLTERIDPTGKRWTVEVAPGGQASYALCLIDAEGNATIPRSYPKAWEGADGRWTSKQRALFALDGYLRNDWTVSDAAVLKAKQRTTYKKDVETIAA